MKKIIGCITMFIVTTPAWAYQSGELFFDPHVAVGYNVAQGTYFLVGADAGYALSEQLSTGVGAFYSAGRRPEHDRAIGGGPFLMYFQPLASFLIASIREDVAYIDQRNPVLLTSGGRQEYTHESVTGVASITSVGLHIGFTRNFGISAGYRAVLALSNSDLGRDRSGTFLGVSIGI